MAQHFGGRCWGPRCRSACSKESTWCWRGRSLSWGTSWSDLATRWPPRCDEWCSSTNTWWRWKNSGWSVFPGACSANTLIFAAHCGMVYEICFKLGGVGGRLHLCYIMVVNYKSVIRCILLMKTTWIINSLNSGFCAFSAEKCVDCKFTHSLSDFICVVLLS